MDNPLVEHLRASLHFDTISISGLDIEGYQFGNAQSLDTDLAPALIEAYYGEKLYRTDPMVLAALPARTLLTEEEAYDLAAPTDRLLYLSRTFSVTNRTLVPIRRGGTIYGAVSISRSTPLTEGERQFLSFVAKPLHEAMTASIMARFGPEQLRLTRGELKCLQCASHGQTSEQIASNTEFTVDTVNSYIKSATRKLGTSNRVEAIAEALRRRLIV